jgi:hypothetical protein
MEKEGIVGDKIRFWVVKAVLIGKPRKVNKEKGTKKSNKRIQVQNLIIK